MNPRFLTACFAALLLSVAYPVAAQDADEVVVAGPTQAESPVTPSEAAPSPPQAMTTQAANAVSQAAANVAHTFQGIVSYYGREFAGRKTANGERFDPGVLTMAHRTLAFGTLVRVTNLTNSRSVVVRVNDRGPFIGGRVGDLSAAAANVIGMLSAGVAHARLEVLGAALSHALK